MTDTLTRTPEQLWSASLAHLVVRLHRQQGGDEALSAPLETLVQALAQASQEGHTCWPCSDEVIPLLRSPVVSRGEASGNTRTPLVIDHEQRAYFRRYWDDELYLAQRWHALNTVAPLGTPEQRRQRLDEAFPDPRSAQQRAAAEAVLTRGVTVITGGPGTGKTTAIARVIDVVLRLQPNLRIALAAPTGKAAARLGSRAQTLHALLGIQPHTGQARYDAARPLPADVIIIDEASMLGLGLARQLFAALAPGTRLVLVGDANQLASVEAGTVLGQLADVSAVRLEQGWRFGSTSSVADMARAVLAGDADYFSTLLRESIHDPLDIDALSSGYATLMQAVRAQAEPSTVLNAFESYRVLAAVIEGPRGVRTLNHLLTKHLLAKYLLAKSLDGARPQGWFHGRPVMVTRNDPALGLINGDTGVALGQPHELRVYFSGGRQYPTTVLPYVETAFALSVHKAQGSEYQQIALVLPEQPNRVVTRELLYTAVTRARTDVRWWASPHVLAAGLETSVRRHSGLAAKIRLQSESTSP